MSFFKLHHITKIRNILSESNVEKLIHTFINSSLDYCYSLLSGCSESSLKSLLLIQSAAMRILTGETEREIIFLPY